MADLLPDAVYRYADREDAVVDLHLPADPDGTLVVLVHGGFWKEQYDRTHTRAQARSLAASGCVVATPEYRRVGGGGGWPRTATDLETAVSALPGALAELGIGWHRAAMAGHSAGGQLALWLLSRSLPITFDVVVAVAGVVDLARAEELGLGNDAVGRLLEDAPVTEADPLTLLTEAPAAAVRLVHGVDDDTVPVELSRRFAAAHPWAELVELPGVGHFEFLDAADPAWAVVSGLLGQTGRR